MMKNKIFFILLLFPFIVFAQERIVSDSDSISTNRIEVSNTYLKYKELSVEAGVSGGFIMRLYTHWEIEPSAFAGYSMLLDRTIDQAINTSPSPHENGISVSVFLRAGYFFFRK